MLSTTSLEVRLTGISCCPVADTSAEMDMVERCASYDRLVCVSCTHLCLGLSARLRRGLKMAALTSPISSTTAFRVLVTPFSPRWRRPSSSTLLAAAMVRSVWHLWTSASCWTLDGRLPLTRRRLNLPLSRSHSSPRSGALCITSDSEVSIACGEHLLEDIYPDDCALVGVAGGFGATIVYPIDLGAWSS